MHRPEGAPAKPLTIIYGHMQAITTKFHGPGNVRGARISATTESGIRVTVPYDYAGTTDDRHANAARALCEKMGWSGALVSGGLAHGGQVFVFLPENYPQKLEAARARIIGEFDNAALVAFGPLGTNTLDDVLSIIDAKGAHHG